jgi:hypothetical protein
MVIPGGEAVEGDGEVVRGRHHGLVGHATQHTCMVLPFVLVSQSERTSCIDSQGQMATPTRPW